jgi:hypothetical protein
VTVRIIRARAIRLLWSADDHFSRRSIRRTGTDGGPVFAFLVKVGRLPSLPGADTQVSPVTTDCSPCLESTAVVEARHSRASINAQSAEQVGILPCRSSPFTAFSWIATTSELGWTLITKLAACRSQMKCMASTLRQRSLDWPSLHFALGSVDAGRANNFSKLQESASFR